MNQEEERRQRQNEAGHNVTRPYMQLLRLNMMVSFVIALVVCASPIPTWVSFDLALRGCAMAFALFWAVTGYSYIQTVNDEDTIDGHPIRKVMLLNSAVTLAGCLFINVWMIKTISGA